MEKVVPFTEPVFNTWKTNKIAILFIVIDKIIYQQGGLRYLQTRGCTRRQCVNRILEHQEAAREWAGIFPPMHVALLSLRLEGFSMTDSRIIRGLEAVKRFAWQDDEGGKRI